jgi:hypothetical protein
MRDPQKLPLRIALGWAALCFVGGLLPIRTPTWVIYGSFMLMLAAAWLVSWLHSRRWRNDPASRAALERIKAAEQSRDMDALMQAYRDLYAAQQRFLHGNREEAQAERPRELQRTSELQPKPKR